jgi:hypothetical protein
MATDAQDDLLEGLEDLDEATEMTVADAGSEAPGAAAKKRPPEQAWVSKMFEGGPHIVLRAFLGVSGLSLLVGFFLPWFTVQGTEMTGLELAVGGPIVNTVIPFGIRTAIGVVPLLGLILTPLGFLGFRFAGMVGLIVGVAIFALAVVAAVMITGVGLWIVVAGTATALAAGGVAFMQGRERRLRARGTKVTRKKRKAEAAA